MAGVADLGAMEPLTDDERAVVDAAMCQVHRTLGQPRFRPFLAALGRDRCYDAATSAYMRAVKAWKREYAFMPYSNFWLRKFLILALAEAAAAGCVALPDTLADAGPMPELTAERTELIACAFKVIPERQREILRLRSAGLTWQQVADALGVSRRLVHRYHARAVRRIWELAPQLRGASHG